MTTAFIEKFTLKKGAWGAHLRAFDDEGQEHSLTIADPAMAGRLAGDAALAAVEMGEEPLAVLYDVVKAMRMARGKT